MEREHTTARAWGREADGLPLDFAIIGAQKAASTFFQRRLDEHPDMAVLPREARHFEDPDYGRGGLRDLTQLLAPHAHLVTGLKRPDYLPKRGVPERVAEHVPRIRLMAILREPVARAVAAYYNMATFGWVPVMDPSQAMKQLLDGTLQRTCPKAQEILEYGRYAEHLQRWQGFFAPDQFLVMLHEDVVTQPTESLTAALRFLQAREDVEFPEIATRDNPGIYWLPRVRLRHARAKFFYDFDPEYGSTTRKLHLGPVAAGVVYGLTVADRLVLRRLGRDRRPRIDAEATRRLREYYAADVAALSGMIDRDLSAWQGSTR